MGQEHKINCEKCGQQQSYGNHKYHLTKNHRYGMMLCDICVAANHDGFRPEDEEWLHLMCLKYNREPPEQDELGFFPFE